MKLTTPFTILRDALKRKSPERTTCYLDDTEVSMKECDAELEEQLKVSNSNFWDEECEVHPTNSHCKIFDD